jgi:Protein of Unknown function (DUF2784)
MLYKILADIVVLIHFLWILFLFFGAFWGIKNKGVKIFHLSGLAFAFIIQIFDWYCPLTHLEVWLRSKHSPTLTYVASFIIHYVEKIVYIEISRLVVLMFTILLCGLNAWLYLRKRP